MIDRLVFIYISNAPVLARLFKFGDLLSGKISGLSSPRVVCRVARYTG